MRELAVLDALIQLDARPAAAVVAPYLDRRPVQSLVLLANAEGRDAVLLPRLASSYGPEWRAIANLLLRPASPGFGYQLLNGLPLRLHVTVTDPTSIQSGMGIGSGLGATPGPHPVGIPGTPPLAEYRFYIEAPGATVMSTGPRVVHYLWRVYEGVTGPARRDLPSQSARDQRERDRVQYVNALVRQTVETVPIELITYEAIRWQGPADYRQRVGNARRLIEDRHGLAVQALLRANRLSQEEAKALARPSIEIVLSDERGDKSESLPAVQ